VLTLYVESSGLVKRYVAEEGSDLLEEAIVRADALAICRIGFVETARATGLAGDERDVKKFEAEWGWFDVIEVDQGLAERAAGLALSHGLRTLDALHLAAALGLEDEDVTFVTWDRRLHGAARAEGLAVLPETLA
jgi:uncharacterized protein